MAEDPENLMLVYLRRLDSKLDGLHADLREMKDRQTDTHAAVLGLRRDQVQDAETVAHLQAQMDRLRDEIDRIKRRLDLGEP